jgi:tetratricopeptide (TPR) repeat protein
LYDSQGKYESAEPLYQRALDIWERQLGADHPSTATSLNNLAALYHSQGKYESAEPLYQRALDIYERQLGADHPDTANSLHNLALLYQSQGKYELAEPLFLRACSILIQTQNVTLQYIGTNVLRFYQIALPAGLPDTTLRNHPLADLILPHLQTPPDTQ